MASRYSFLAVVFAMACVSAVTPPPSAGQSTPPAGSPTALGQRPRLFITAGQIPAIRTRLKTLYKAEFQSLLDRLANPSLLTSAQRNIEADWGSMNAAFVAALGPQALASDGFTIAGSIDTPQKLCGKAMAYARQSLSDIAAAKSLGHSSLTTGYPTALYLPVAATYDWCHGWLSQGDKNEIADAFVTGFEKKYGGKNPLKIQIAGLNMVANNQAAVNIHDSIAAVAFWGDSYPALDVQQRMYATFSGLWLTRLRNELDAMYGEGANWHEGPGGYMHESLTSLAIGYGAISSALDQPFAAQLPLFARLGEFLVGAIKPNTTAATCGPSSSDQCRPFFERWGTVSGGVEGPACTSLMLAAGLLRVSGASDAAGIVKHVIDVTRGDCGNAGKSYGGVWANGVFDWFILGDRGITPRSPDDAKLPRSMKHGLGLYTLRSGYRQDDTQIAFFAPATDTYGHGSPDWGSFTLHKRGNLIVHAGNGKSGDGALSIPADAPSLSPLVRNVLTLHKGAVDHSLGTNGQGPAHATLAAYGNTELRGAGLVRAEQLNGSGFDYISYDMSQRWAPATATLAQRELVYLRGAEDHEYVVVFDRFNAAKPGSDDKIWRIWVPTMPTFVNGSPFEPRAGKVTSTSTDTIVVTNEGGPFPGNDFSGGTTSGRFFMRTLWPKNPVVNFIGGPGMEYQSGQDDGSQPWGNGSQTATTRQYLGIGRVEVRPSESQAYDIFLNVIQFGNAKSLTQIAPIMRVESNAMVGSYIADPANSWVVLFARDSWPGSPRSSVNYSVLSVSATSRHLIANLVADTTLYVNPVNNGGTLQVGISPSPNGGSPVRTSDAGVLYFELNGQSVHAPVVPISPKNLRVGD
ncbi:MAG TPA: hypothetical protein VMF13_20310 [Luteitalea sp.]|nr:hypothetical protein [Luteitalea sp.]